MPYARKPTLVALALTALFTVGIGTSPASANTNDGYVSGAGDLYDDWNDEGTVSVNSHTYSNATCLWQNILYAEGYGDHDDVDGVFGSVTKSRTEDLQQRWNLIDDGIAGEKTWTKAGTKLTAGELINESTNKKYRMVYSGSRHSFYVYRSDTGVHGFHEPTGTFRRATYNLRTC